MSSSVLCLLYFSWLLLWSSHPPTSPILKKMSINHCKTFLYFFCFLSFWWCKMSRTISSNSFNFLVFDDPLSCVIVGLETTDDDLQNLPCSKCNKLFPGSMQLKRHVKSVHESSTKLNCKYCMKDMGNLDVYKQHVLNVHKVVN